MILPSVDAKQHRRLTAPHPAGSIPDRPATRPPADGPRRSPDVVVPARGGAIRAGARFEPKGSVLTSSAAAPSCV